MFDFADMAWLFQCDNRNRGIIRMNFDEAALLWKTARRTVGPILEIGRCRAGSTALLAAAAPGRRIVSVDLAPKHAREAEAFLARPEMAEQIELRVGDSRVPFPDERFGMLFIDGDHEYDGVRADVAAHWAELESFEDAPPLAVFHDAEPNPGLAHENRINHAPGVTRLCEALVAAGIAERITTAGSVSAVRKVKELPPDF